MDNEIEQRGLTFSTSKWTCLSNPCNVKEGVKEIPLPFYSL